MRKMYTYLKYSWWQALLAISLVVLRVSLDLTLPDIMSSIIDDGILKNNLDVITSLGLKMIVTALAVMLIFMMSSYLAASIGSKVAHIIRKDLFRKIESFSMVEFDHFSSASLITRATGDVAQVQQILTMSFRILLAAPLYGTIALIKATQINAHLAMTLGAIIPLIFLIIFGLFKLTAGRYDQVQRLTDTLNRLFRETLMGIRVIRATNGEAFQSKKLTDVSQDVSNQNTTLVRIIGLLEPSIQILMSLGILVMVYLGSNAIQARQLQIGQMMAFIQYTTQVTTSLLSLSMVMSIYPRAAVSGQRIAEVLALEPTILDPLTPKDLSLEGITVEFKNVDFTYPKASKPALTHISFVAKPNTVTAIIGSTGSGKSTLMHLLVRLYDPTKGAITFNGTPLPELSQKSIHDRVAFIPQKAQLFSGTLESSISMGHPAETQRLLTALDIAQAKAFIDESPDGLKRSISQGATNLSGGQRQRLSIARALLKDASVYLFDDSFSALDFRTDAALRKALHANLTNATLFIVGQRVSSVMHADQILVMDKGELVASGTHHELLKHCQVYQEIAASQLSVEELA